MAQQWPPLKNSAYSFGFGLRSQADSSAFVSNATVTAADFSISTEFGSFVSLTNTPRIAPAAGKQVVLDLTAAEMNNDNITVLGSDAVGAQWLDVMFFIQPLTTSLSTFNASTNSVGVKASGILAGAIGADAIDATALAAMNLSDVTVRVQPMLYSGMTVGVNNIAPATYSGVTVEGTNIALTAAGVDAIWDDPVSEPAGVFAWASATPRKILTWLGALSSNSLSQSSVLQTLRDRGDTTSIATAPASSSSTFFVRGSFT